MATGLVAVASVLYVLWAAGAALPGMSGTRATGAVILVLGFLASVSAVVPTFNQLLRGNKLYLIATSVIGAVAAVAGVRMLTASSEVALAVVIAAMVALWLMATMHHSVLARDEARRLHQPANPAAGITHHETR